jgi:hypothetical protein
LKGEELIGQETLIQVPISLPDSDHTSLQLASMKYSSVLNFFYSTSLFKIFQRSITPTARTHFYWLKFEIQVIHHFYENKNRLVHKATLAVSGSEPSHHFTTHLSRSGPIGSL